jgi:acyl-CoA thioesterase-1
MIRRTLLALALLLFLLPASAQETITLLAFGDSLTAGLGVDPQSAFPAKLEEALKARGHNVRVINAGVSGDTAAAGRDRLDWVLTDDIDAVIVELGANDALRGIAPTETRSALNAILEALKQRNLPVLLAGMLAPRNLGPDYAAGYDPIFPDLAKTYDAVYYPFFLDGVATQPALNQADGLHPNPAGVTEIVTRITPSVEELLARVAAK